MLPTEQIPEENPWVGTRYPGQRDWEGSFHLPISSFKRGLVLGIPLLPALPTPKFSPSNMQHLIHVDETLRKKILKKNIFLLLTLRFSLPLAWKMGPSAGEGLRKWGSFIFWEILSGFHLSECPLHRPREMFYKDNHDLFNARHWVKCLTSMIISAPLRNGPWWRLNDPWHMKQSHVRHSKANFIDHLRLHR